MSSLPLLPGELYAAAIEFPWSKPPLSMNDRYANAKHKAAKNAETRDLARMIFRSQRIPKLEFVTVKMVWFVTNKIRRDVENPVATLKPVCDALVLEDIVPDDDPRYMDKLMPQITPGEAARVVFYLEGRRA